jgi:hypothetical protein
MKLKKTGKWIGGNSTISPMPKALYKSLKAINLKKKSPWVSKHAHFIQMSQRLINTFVKMCNNFGKIQN